MPTICNLDRVREIARKMAIHAIWLSVFSLLACSRTTVLQSAEASKSVGDIASTPTSAKYDGPAELPRAYVRSALADTPTPGKALEVKAGADLQRALDEAACGDTIRLQVGATFTGRFTLPAKNCDDSHWIIIRTSAPDTALPPEGTRITPCYARVESLPGRPLFHCSSVENVVAKLQAYGTQPTGPLILSDGANHYRLLGLEITRPTGGSMAGLVQPPSPAATANHIIFDRDWIHGTSQDETARGILLVGSYFAVVDSFFTDFHCIARSGACTDSQDVAGGVGNSSTGPYKLVNNFLEAAGESLILGGSRATAAPTDIEVRHNYFFKPLIWKPGQAGFVGGPDGNPFIVKNHFELKNAKRVLFENNVLENTWGGFSQEGYSILLTPRNQEGGGGMNLCPECEVTDITIRYCHISHVADGITLGNGRSENGGVPRDGQRYSIHDVVFDDIDGNTYHGNGFLVLIGTSPAGGVPILQHVKIDHITAFPSRAVLNVGGPQSEKMADFTFTNSIVYAGGTPYPFTSTGGGRGNCSEGVLEPERMLKQCFSSYVFAKNVIIGSPPVAWPPSNVVVPNASAVRFVDYRGAQGGNYHLQTTSRFSKAGTDGKDLGADINAVDLAIAGAR